MLPKQILCLFIVSLAGSGINVLADPVTIKAAKTSQQTYSSSSSKSARQTYPSITNEAEYAEFVRAQEGLNSSSSSKQKSSTPASKKIKQ